MPITLIDRKAHRDISLMIEDELKALGDKHGLTFTTGGGMFSGSGTGMFKIEAVVKDIGSGISGAEAQFRSAAGLYGIDPDCFGKTFVSGKHTFTITGYRPNARVNCFDAKSSWDQKTYVFPPESIRAHFPFPVKASA